MWLASKPYTHAALPEVDTISPSKNYRSSHDVLEHVGQWVKGAATRNIIHINCDLHGIRHNQGCSGPVADIEAYRSNLIQIFDYLKQAEAKVIWTSSTPPLESAHSAVKPSRRYLVDLKVYDRAARNLARQYGFTANDLYSLVFEQDLTDVVLRGGLYFNELGSKMIGRAVAGAIPKQIG